MRTTVDLTPGAYQVVQIVARERNSLGKVISEFILNRPPHTFESNHSAAGFPVFASGKTVTSADVRTLLDDE